MSQAVHDVSNSSLYGCKIKFNESFVHHTTKQLITPIERVFDVSHGTMMILYKVESNGKNVFGLTGLRTRTEFEFEDLVEECIEKHN